MTSRSAVLRGVQHPRYQSVPLAPSSAGVEAVELAASAGLILDPWQALVLEGALRERSDGTWAAFEVGLVVPRQNGKGSVLEALVLASLYLFGDDLILWSAHEFKTAAEAFRRVLTLIQSTHDLDRRVQRVRTSHGDEGIELKSGQRLRFVARSTGSGRGFSGDKIILDEAYNLPDHAMAALLPTMSARPNPQLWYTSSAPLPRVESDTLRRLCLRGRQASRGEATEPRLAYFEWSGEGSDDVAQANPAYGIRIFPEFTASERGAMSAEDYERERIGIYIERPETIEPVINPAAWSACLDVETEAIDPVVLAFDVAADRKWSVIASAAASTRGGTHVEVVDNRRGTAWVVDRLLDLKARHEPYAIICNPAGPAGGLLPECKRKGLEVGVPNDAGKAVAFSGRDFAQACQSAVDAITNRQWRHLGQPELDTAVGAAVKKESTAGSFTLESGNGTDISPLLAVTIAAAVAGRPDDDPEPFMIVT